MEQGRFIIKQGVLIGLRDDGKKGGEEDLLCRLERSLLGLPSAPQCGNGGVLVVPEGVTRIGREAFSGAGQIVVSIPRSVTSIDDLAFYNGDVVSISYEGTIDEWKAIVKGET